MVGRELFYQDPLFLFLWWPFILITQNFFDRHTFLTIVVLFMIKILLFGIEIIQFSILVRWCFFLDLVGAFLRP